MCKFMCTTRYDNMWNCDVTFKNWEIALAEVLFKKYKVSSVIIMCSGKGILFILIAFIFVLKICGFIVLRVLRILIFWYLLIKLGRID